MIAVALQSKQNTEILSNILVEIVHGDVFSTVLSLPQTGMMSPHPFLPLPPLRPAVGDPPVFSHINT